MKWLGDISPRIRWRTTYREKKSTQSAVDRPGTQDFRLVHFPDRPPRSSLYRDVPTEEELRALILGSHKDRGDVVSLSNPNQRATTMASSTATATPPYSRAKPILQLDIPKGVHGRTKRERDALQEKDFFPETMRAIEDSTKTRTAEPRDPETARHSAPQQPKHKSTPGRERYMDKMKNGGTPLRSAPIMVPSLLSPFTMPPKHSLRSAPGGFFPDKTADQIQTERDRGALSSHLITRPKKHICNLCRGEAGTRRTGGLCQRCDAIFSSTQEAYTTRRSLYDRPLPPLPHERDHVALHCKTDGGASSSSSASTASTVQLWTPVSVRSNMDVKSRFFVESPSLEDCLEYYVEEADPASRNRGYSPKLDRLVEEPTSWI